MVALLKNFMGLALVHFQKYWLLMFMISLLVAAMKEADRILQYGDAGNYSLCGFEMTLTRNAAK